MQAESLATCQRTSEYMISAPTSTDRGFALDFRPLTGSEVDTYFVAIRTASRQTYVPLETCLRRVLARTLHDYEQR
jgi:cobalamin biosynthesis Mg chelatase CobN